MEEVVLSLSVMSPPPPERPGHISTTSVLFLKSAAPPKRLMVI